METRRITCGYFALLCALAMSLSVSSTRGSSSLGGAPGRSEGVRWKSRSKPASDAKKQIATPVASTAPQAATRKTKFVWNVPAYGESREAPTPLASAYSDKANLASTSVEAAARGDPAPMKASDLKQGEVTLSPLDLPPSAPLAFPSPAARAVAYEQVLTPRQKAILHDRALAFSLSPRDYEHLMSDDERAHIEAQITERKRRLATQE